MVSAIGAIACGAFVVAASACDSSNPAPASNADGMAGRDGAAGAPEVPQGAPPRLTSCADAIATGASSLLDDFDDGDMMALRVEGRSGVWYSFTDGTAGSLRMEVAADGDGHAFHLNGGGFSEWAPQPELAPLAPDGGGRARNASASGRTASCQAVPTIVAELAGAHRFRA